MEIKNAKVLITGGSRGIGKAIAKLLKENGAKVAITGRTKSDLDAAASELGVFPIHADVAKKEDIEKTYQSFLKEFNKLDVLINNAGIGSWAEVDKLSREEFQRIFEVNVFGAAMMGKKAAELFKQQKFGNIINIGSTAGLKGYPGGSIYVSSKFALRGLTECWRAELRPYNVRVFQVNPSEVVTSFGRTIGKSEKEVPHKLRPLEIAHSVKSILEMDNRGFIPELSVWATNPWKE